jgi:hypothetical protein
MTVRRELESSFLYARLLVAPLEVLVRLDLLALPQTLSLRT